MKKIIFLLMLLVVPLVSAYDQIERFEINEVNSVDVTLEDHGDYATISLIIHDLTYEINGDPFDGELNLDMRLHYFYVSSDHLYFSGQGKGYDGYFSGFYEAVEDDGYLEIFVTGNALMPGSNEEIKGIMDITLGYDIDSGTITLVDFKFRGTILTLFDTQYRIEVLEQWKMDFTNLINSMKEWLFFSDNDNLCNAIADECGHTIIECYADEDCPEDGYPDEPDYCFENNLYRDYRDHFCENPGTSQSYCTYLAYPEVVEECELCEDGACVLIVDGIQNNDFDPLDYDVWTSIGTEDYWKQREVPSYEDTLIHAGNRGSSEHILKQYITIPSNAKYLRWSISPTNYGDDPDQYNARASLKFNDIYLLDRYNPPEDVIENIITIDIEHLRGQSGWLELIQHATGSWSCIMSDWIRIEGEAGGNVIFRTNADKLWIAVDTNEDGVLEGYDYTTTTGKLGRCSGTKILEYKGSGIYVYRGKPYVCEPFDSGYIWIKYHDESETAETSSIPLEPYASEGYEVYS